MSLSGDNELLILVDRHDREIGFASRADAHRGRGALHRAFSLFVFNPAGELLLQQRADSKRLWPGHWSNTCCSHARRGEKIDAAAHRRLREELGLDAELRFVFKFEYHEQYDEHGSEHELCWVYVGRSSERPLPNENEVAAWRYLSPHDLLIEIACAPETFTPWFKLAWARILEGY